MYRIFGFLFLFAGLVLMFASFQFDATVPGGVREGVAGSIHELPRVQNLARSQFQLMLLLSGGAFFIAGMAAIGMSAIVDLLHGVVAAGHDTRVEVERLRRAAVDGGTVASSR